MNKIFLEEIELCYSQSLGTPIRGRSLIESIRQLIKKARHNIIICSCEFTNGSDFVINDEIINQLERGCKVSVYGNSQEQMKGLKKNFKGCEGYNNLRVFTWNPPTVGRTKKQVKLSLFHIKAITVDNNHCYLGSANLSWNAMQNSVEWGIVTHSTDLCLDLESYIDELVDNGRFTEVTL